MLKSAFFSLLALCLCLSVYGSNVQCPHGCGDPNTDKRIFQIENTIRSCFEQLAAISESNYEKFLDNDTALYRAYFTPRFESEHSVATLSLDRRGSRYGSYTNDILFYRKWKRKNTYFEIQNEKDEQLAHRWRLSWESWNEKKFAETHLCYSGYEYHHSSEGRYEIEGDYVSTQMERYSLQSYSSVLLFFNSIQQSVVDLYRLLSVYQQFEVKIAERSLQWEINHRDEMQKLINSSRRDCYCRCKNPYSDCFPCLNCRVRYAEEAIQLNQNEVRRHHQEMPLYLAVINQKQAEVAAIYLSLYDHCIQNHQTPWSYYQRGLIRFQNGEIERSLDDIRVLIETYENENKTDQLPPMTYFDRGVAESELGLYHDAISSLSTAIQRDPTNKEAYFERAVAYFEEGEFELALKDYLASELKLPAQEIDYLDYGQGFVSGIKKGVQEEFGENFPLAASILNMGLWALANTPSPHAKLIQASIACVAAAGLYLTADQMVTGLRDLVANWDHLSSHEQGELCGYLIGKYGIDVFAVAGSAKMIEAYRNLKRSNQLLSFDYVLRSPSEVEVIKACRKGVDYKILKINPDEFSKLGCMLDRAELTKAGRSLMKHGYRPRSAFPKPVGTPEQINELGQKVLESILHHPDKIIYKRPHPSFGKVIDIMVPGKGGARFTADGKEMVGFLEPLRNK